MFEDMPLKQWWLVPLASFLLGMLGTSVMASLLIGPRLSSLEEAVRMRTEIEASVHSALRDRITALENGSMTPMAAETRAMFSQHERRMDRIESMVLEMLAKMKRNESRATVPQRVAPKGG